MNSVNNKIKKKDNLLQTILSIVVIALFFIIVILIYKYFIVSDYHQLLTEGFDNVLDTSNTSGTSDTINIPIPASSTDTIYETSLKTLYSNNKYLICSMLPSIGSNTTICQVNDTPYVIYQFPIHMIKLNDGSILAVFNDGRLYQKDNMNSTMWKGPITNSLPQNIIPLRMIALTTNLNTLIGVGYDNNLYIKSPDSTGMLNLEQVWKKVPNNKDIIYVLFDNNTNYLISIDISGKLLIKSTTDLTSNNVELFTKLDRPVLRLYYDLNGYMLVVDNKFDLYQFSDISWKDTPLNIQRGANSSKIQDLLYDNDGKLYGLIFNPDASMVQIMKQASVFYLSDFMPLNLQLKTSISSTSSDFVLSDQNIISCKNGSIYDFITTNANANANGNVDDDNANDNDPNYAYQKQVIENKAKLLSFCSNRGSSTSSVNYDNYDLLASVEKNVDKISEMKSIINKLLSYEPQKTSILEKYPDIL